MPCVLALSLVTPKHWRNGLLALASLLFYTWGAGGYVLLLLGCSALSFGIGRVLADPTVDERTRRRLLVVGIVVLLGALAVWKYAGFATSQVETFLGSLGLRTDRYPVIELALPIGISFFTFQALSYLIDVARGEEPARGPIDFFMYLAMFPQLVAGPIVRYKEIADQIPVTERDRVDDIAHGFQRFALGLCKKVLVADVVAPVADVAFADSANLTTTTAVVGAFAYAMQIFFDFSGYSDMAIGLGRMFGFRLPENFDRPYSAVSVTDFWRRWHLTLSNWFRDYVYIPLGGNRGSQRRVMRNLVIVFLLTGLWHGANWTFVLWGAVHGGALLVERVTGLRQHLDERPNPARQLLTFVFVLLAWVLFRAPSLDEALRYYASFAELGGLGGTVQAALSPQRALTLALAATVLLFPRHTPFVRGPDAVPSLARSRGRLLVSTAGVAAAGLVVAAGTFSPFLYFQF